MQEQTISATETNGPASGAGLFDDSSDGGGLASVSSGVYAEQIPVAGMTVGDIRRRYADRFDIDPESQAVVDGQDVGDDVVLGVGQSLMFTHRSGEKGAARRVLPLAA
jgi:hypothetical protein